ncbi:hypothetical protein BDQ12DRAFT_691659 [Crucibulum laeve]|uniref:Uncharacterized protein n=1 Tax=Crucibulum laeve TaxID=68775 RepID=A0A5C3LWD3_9AGAR|nr:hypothetical protein BDQ12DRAFT_691659 [Crucibulum laeve]
MLGRVGYAGVKKRERREEEEVHVLCRPPLLVMVSLFHLLVALRHPFSPRHIHSMGSICFPPRSIFILKPVSRRPGPNTGCPPIPSSSFSRYLSSGVTSPRPPF